MSAGDALDRARSKAYWRILPLCFVCYVIAYVDRANVAIAKLTMIKDLPAFNNDVIGYGAGLFFIGYIFLEIPGTLLVERWSARKWICRIMVSWGIVAALTAAVKTPMHFYIVRFLLGLAEAGFYPGVIVYLTHWFPTRDRARALAYFFVATPMAQVLSPKISNVLLHLDTLGISGWQWLYIFWGLPAIALGIVVLVALPDKPRDARWLSEEEKAALEAELIREHSAHPVKHKMTVLEALSHPKVLLLSAAYFFVVTSSYGIEFFMPSILQRWYNLDLNKLTWLVILPPLLAVFGQLFIGWSSDRSKERRLHTVVPIVFSAIGLLLVVSTQGNLAWTVALFMIAFAGFKAYLPAFWSLPNLFLTQAAAAGSIGLINSLGNLGGFMGPYLMGKLETITGSFENGLYVLGVTSAISAAIIFGLGLGNREKTAGGGSP